MRHNMANPIRTFSRLILAAFFVLAGTGHFLFPTAYLQIMPPVLPFPMALIFISGIAEVAGGAAVLIPALRAIAGWGLITLLVAVFPANIYASFHGMSFFGQPVPGWMLWVRLPVQFLFIAWVYFSCMAAGPAGEIPQPPR